MVRKVNEVEFKNEALSGCTVVDFFATWCGPCRMLSPIMESLSEEMKDVKFLKVDVDEEGDLASNYGVSNIPAVLVLKDGNLKDILVGFKPQNVLKSEIENLLK